jgi:hypothetical protein
LREAPASGSAKNDDIKHGLLLEKKDRQRE